MMCQPAAASLDRMSSSPQPITTVWFQAKTGRRIGANALIQGFVTSTFQSYRTWVRSPSGRKVQRPRPSSSPEACPSMMDMGSMRVMRVSKVS